MSRNLHSSISRWACALALLAGPALATQEKREISDLDLLALDLNTVLERFQEAQEQTQTIVADFDQRKSSSLLAQEETSSGRLYYSQPDKFVWAFTEPDDTLLLINGDTMVTWYKDLNKAQVVDIASKKKRVLQYLAIGEQVQELKKTFLITLRAPGKEDPDGSLHLELIPKNRRVRDRLTSLDMWLDGDTYLPVQLRYDQKDGDFTVFTLSNVEPNTVIEEERFSLELPDGVDVDTSLSRPIQGE